jgi:hypothetical protein
VRAAAQRSGTQHWRAAVGAATAAARPLLARQGQLRQQLSFATKAVSAEPAVATTTGERPLSNRWLGQARIGTCCSSSCSSGQHLHSSCAFCSWSSVALVAHYATCCMCI